MAENKEFSAAHVRCASFILEMIEKYAPQIHAKEKSEDEGIKDKVRISKSA